MYAVFGDLVISVLVLLLLGLFRRDRKDSPRNGYFWATGGILVVALIISFITLGVDIAKALA